MAAHADAASAGGRHWMAVHCDENIGAFNEGVRQLRKKVEPAGCKVITSLLLRRAVDQAVSEWHYFYEGNVNNEGGDASWATDLFGWVRNMQIESTLDGTIAPHAHAHALTPWR